MSKLRLLLMVAVLITAVSAQAGKWEGTVVEVDGVEHIKNPKQPMRPEFVVEAVRLWSVGGDSDEDELLGVIAAIAVDEDGNTYMLDSQLTEVRVYGPDGSFVRNIGREGEGPGEFRQPSDLFLLPENRFGVVQLMPSRIVCFNRNGEPMPDLNLPSDGGFSMVTSVQATADALVVQKQTMSFAENQAGVLLQLVCLDYDGKTQSTLWERNMELPKSKIAFDASGMSPAVWTAAHDGRVFVSPTYDAYCVDVYSTGGAVLRVIEREYESLEYTDEEVAKFEQQIEQLSVTGTNVEFKLGDTKRDISGMIARQNGELWIGSSRSRATSADDVLGAWEVFSKDGRYVRNVSIAVDCREERDTWFLIEDQLYVVKEGMGSMRALSASRFPGGAPVASEQADDLDPPEVICYRLKLPKE